MTLDDLQTCMPLTPEYLMAAHWAALKWLKWHDCVAPVSNDNHKRTEDWAG